MGMQGAVAPGEDIGRLAEVVDGQPVALLAECQLGIQRGQQHLVVDGVDQLPGDLLQHAEIEDEQALGIDGTLDRHADPVVVAVERSRTGGPRKVMKWAEAKTR